MLKPLLPAEPGTYVLLLRADVHRTITIGHLGVLEVRPGWYVYVGSALGPGGLAGRVGRHAKMDKPFRWHIDYLAAVAVLEEVWYTADGTRRECQWAEVLSQLRGATVPLEAFGSSDCRCRTHLFFLQKPPSLRAFRRLLARSIPGHGPVRVERLGEGG